MPSAFFTPRSDDTTVLASTLWLSVAPCVATVADDDPPPSEKQGRVHSHVPVPLHLKQGRVHQNTNAFEESDTNTFEEFDKPFYRWLAIQLHEQVHSDDESHFASVPEDSMFQTGDGPPDVGDDLGALRALTDTGAFASVTDPLHMLHDYKIFGPKHHSPLC